MKAFLSALVAIVVIGAASYAILDRSVQINSEQAFTTSAVRLPQGH